MQAQPKPKYTYKDYLNWPEEEHWELIDGVPYPTYGPTAISSPNLIHQATIRDLLLPLANHLEGKMPCEVLISPLDVIFEDDENTLTVVQPDLLVICDQSKAREKNIVGAPDIAIEVLSTYTTVKDWVLKSRLYEKRGVKEYWIVSPSEKALYQNILKDGEYETTTFIEEGQLTTEILEGFSLDIEALFKLRGENP